MQLLRNRGYRNENEAAGEGEVQDGEVDGVVVFFSGRHGNNGRDGVRGPVHAARPTQRCC